MENKKLHVAPSSIPFPNSSDSASLPASLHSPLEALPIELLNLIFDSLVQSRCLFTEGCCRNSEPCCRTLGISCASLHGALGQKRCGVREVSSLLLSSKAMCIALRSLPSFSALLFSHSVVFGSCHEASLLAPAAPLPPEHTATWVRSLYLRELQEPEAPNPQVSTQGPPANALSPTPASSSVGPTPSPNWQCRLLQHFSGLVVLHVPHWFSDVAAVAIPKLTSLRTLCLRGSSISDTGLRHVAESPSIEELDLSSTEVTSEGLQTLVQLKRLRLLNLSFCHSITSSSGVHLQHMKQLQELFLSGTLVTDETLMLLGGLAKLRKLRVEHCEELSDFGLDVAERLIVRNHARSVRMRGVRDWGRSFMEITPLLC